MNPWLYYLLGVATLPTLSLFVLVTVFIMYLPSNKENQK